MTPQERVSRGENLDEGVPSLQESSEVGLKMLRARLRAYLLFRDVPQAPR